MIMVRPGEKRFGHGLLVLGLLVLSFSCRRAHFPSRGGSAAVVVAAPRSDAAGPPRVYEREPNDSPEQAQFLDLNADWPVLSVVGTLSGVGDGKGRDVDVFRLTIPGSRSVPDKPNAVVDSALPEDPRALARRLSFEITCEAGLGLSLQLLDAELKVLGTVAADAGETAGLPNMAALPGHSYYFRVRALARPGKPVQVLADSSSVSTYKVAIQLGDFEPGDEREPNDGTETAETPSLMQGTVELAGYYGWLHDQDYYRIPAPEIPSAIEAELDAVDGVTAGLQVQDGSGAKLAVARGRKGERLGVHNVIIPTAAPDAKVGNRFFYVVVRAESGQNRDQRYVLHLTMGPPIQDSEVEPNDNPAQATPVRDGVTTGFLPVGDVDYFLYSTAGQRDVSFEVTAPSRVRVKLELVRQTSGQLLGSIEAKKPRQSVTLQAVDGIGGPILLRLSQGKGDGNSNDPYAIKITSVAKAPQ